MRLPAMQLIHDKGGLLILLAPRDQSVFSESLGEPYAPLLSFRYIVCIS